MDRSRYARFSRFADPETFAPLRHAIERMMQDLATEFPQSGQAASSGFLTPKVDVAELEGGLEISAELPGVRPDDIDIDVADGVLTLKAERLQEAEQADEKRRFHVVERSHGVFLRRFTLPFPVDEEAIEARFAHGVLRIFAPHAKPVTPPSRKIEIRSE